MGIFSKKKKESPVVKGRAETSDEFAGRIVQELNSEANKSSASLPTSHNTVNDTQGTIIDILKQQSSDEKFFMAIIFSGVLAYVAFSLIVSIVTSVLLLSLALIFLTPLRLEETSSHQPESMLHRLKRSLRPKTEEEIQRNKNKKAIKQIKKVLQSDDVGRGIASLVDSVLDSD